VLGRPEYKSIPEGDVVKAVEIDGRENVAEVRCSGKAATAIS
jgi:hypothetical protein